MHMLCQEVNPNDKAYCSSLIIQHYAYALLEKVLITKFPPNQNFFRGVGDYAFNHSLARCS